MVFTEQTVKSEENARISGSSRSKWRAAQIADVLDELSDSATENALF